MKKIILVVFTTMAVTTTLFSQIKFMPKAGVSLSKVHLSDDLKSDGEDIKSKIGFVLGVAVEIPLIGEKVSLQPEILFQQNGAKSEYKEVNYSEETSVTTNYISVPVLAMVNFGKFFAEVGPSFGFGIGGKYKYTANEAGNVFEQSGKIKFGKEPDNTSSDDSYIDNAFDLGLQIGAGMKISVIVIDLRYGLGLSNMNDVPDGYTDDYKSKNNSWQLTVGIPLGGKK